MLLRIQYTKKKRFFKTFNDKKLQENVLSQFLPTYVRVRTIKQKNFMLLVTETNHGLAYDRDVKVPFETS